jgi:hypothetical protein
MIKRRPTCYLVHGFNVRDGGESTTHNLEGLVRLRGYEVEEVKVGWLGRIGVRVCNDNLAALLTSIVDPGSVAIGHSNGAAMLQLAVEMGATFDHLIYINPALDHDRPLPPQVKSLNVWADRRDIWPRLAAAIPFSPWGSMGTDGHSGAEADERIRNHFHGHGHSGLMRRRPCVAMVAHQLPMV